MCRSGPARWCAATSTSSASARAATSRTAASSMSPTTARTASRAAWPRVIGEDVTIGHGAIIHACTIEDACLIGMGATILDGAVVRKNGFVGAGAVVSAGQDGRQRRAVAGQPGQVRAAARRRRKSSSCPTRPSTTSGSRTNTCKHAAGPAIAPQPAVSVAGAQHDRLRTKLGVDGIGRRPHAVPETRNFPPPARPACPGRRWRRAQFALRAQARKAIAASP